MILTADPIIVIVLNTGLEPNVEWNKAWGQGHNVPPLSNPQGKNHVFTKHLKIYFSVEPFV